jgi:hypothetical protein
VAVLVIERNLPLVTPNKPQKNQINRPKRLSSKLTETKSKTAAVAATLDEWQS